jgi:hypothetical protein
MLGRVLQSRSPLRDLLLRLTPPAAAGRQLTRIQAWEPPADHEGCATGAVRE